MAGTKKAPRRYGSCTLHQRGKKGIWWIEYRQEGERKRYSLDTSDLSIAEQKAVGISSALDRGDYQIIEHGGTSITFGDFLDNVFCKRFTGWQSEETWRQNASKFKQFKLLWGKKLLDKITEYDILSHLDMKAQSQSASTRNKYKSTLSTIFSNAKSWGYIKRDPLHEIRFLKTTTHSPDPLSVDDIAKLMPELPEYTRKTVILLWDTGIRWGEWQKLMWNDVDFENKQIVIKKAKNANFRSIPLTERALGIFREFQAESTGPKVALFKRINKGLASASRRAGIPHVTPHRFRHTFATEIWESGAKLQDLMQILGHSTPAMSLRYARLRSNQMRETIARLNR